MYCLQDSLKDLFNLSLSLSSFPDEWKTATVTPILKPNKPSDNISSYRPISILPPIGKLLDRIVSQRLMTYLVDQDVISDQQYGFIRHRNGIQQLLVILSNVHRTLDQKEEYDAVFLDFAKAFDRVSHLELLSRLGEFSSPQTKLWFQSYLENRAIKVKIDNDLSTSHPLSAGVPQGSHLGPLLFAIYIDSLSSAVAESDLYLFADDTTLGQSSTNTSLQQDLNNCHQWASRVGGSFNPSKSVSMRFYNDDVRTLHTASKCTCTIPFRLDNGIIDNVNQHKHLGVILQSNMSWSAHTAHTMNTFRQRVSLLSFMSPYLPPNTISILYKSYARPIIEYACEIWGVSLPTQDTTAIDKLQARIARCILSRAGNQLPWITPKEDLFSACNLASPSWRRQIQCLCTIHRNIHNDSLLQACAVERSHSSRRPNFLLLTRKLGKYSQRHLFAQFLSIWNLLPHDIRCISSPATFRQEIEHHFLKYKFSPSGILS